MNRRVLTAAAVGIVAAAVGGWIVDYVVEPARREVVAVTLDCPGVDAAGLCVGSSIKFGPRRGYTIVVALGGIAGALGFALAYRRGRSPDVPEARVSR